MAQRSTELLRKIIILSVAAVTFAIGVGVLRALFPLSQPLAPGILGWYLFSFVSGLSMIVLPCSLPLLFVISPLSPGKRPMAGLSLALAFGLGVAVVLSLYGVVTALLGETIFSFAHMKADDIKNGVYFISGSFAYLFALGEIGLINFRMPSYVGVTPRAFQRHNGLAQAFFLGLFLGTIGVGSPHPAMPLLLIESASSADLFYGWSLFLTHAIGRVLPLVLLSLFAMYGVNSAEWLLARKERIVSASGWSMVFVAGFILTLGLFSHDWFTNSGQPYALLRLTGGEVSGLSMHGGAGLQTIGRPNATPNAVGIFGQPAAWGNWFLVFLWIMPLFAYYRREKLRVLRTPALQIQRLERELLRIEEERRGIEAVLHIPQGMQGARIKELEHQMDGLMKERTVLEEAMRFGAKSGIRDTVTQCYEEQLLRMRRNWYITLALLLVLTFAIFLPL